MADIDLGFAELEQRIPITRRVGVGRPPNSANNNRNAPEKIDFFEITSDYRGNAFSRDEDAHKVLHAAGYCGDPSKPYDPRSGPRRLPIRLLSDDISDSMMVRWQTWGGSRLLCEGNGKVVGGAAKRAGQVIPCRASREFPEWGAAARLKADKVVSEQLAKEGVPTSRVNILTRLMQLDEPNGKGAGKRCIFAEGGSCKCVSQLVFAIDGLPGLCRFRSHGINTAKELMTSMMLLGRETQGVFRNVPLMLVVKWKPVTYEGKTSSAPIVHVEERESSVALKEFVAAELHNRAQLTGQIAEDRKLLKAAMDVDAELVDKEFGQGDGEAVVAAAVEGEEKPSGNLGGGK